MFFWQNRSNLHQEFILRNHLRQRILVRLFLFVIENITQIFRGFDDLHLLLGYLLVNLLSIHFLNAIHNYFLNNFLLFLKQKSLLRLMVANKLLEHVHQDQSSFLDLGLEFTLFLKVPLKSVQRGIDDLFAELFQLFTSSRLHEIVNYLKTLKLILQVFGFVLNPQSFVILPENQVVLHQDGPHLKLVNVDAVLFAFLLIKYLLDLCLDSE